VSATDAFLKSACEWVEDGLNRWLPPDTQEPVRLHKAMRYSLFAGGKRLRPAVALAACRAVGGSDDAALPTACALEMLHTYSLVHDDLPAVDNDDLRRGQPTCHVKFDEATAILAGDALQTQAFWVLSAKTDKAEVATKLVQELAAAAGTFGMVGGEVADIEAEGKTPQLEIVEHIHTRKTAALFRASAVMGGIAGGADARALEALRNYGEWLGLAFQIVDDVLDETSDAETLGKSPGKDRASGKMSYPAAVGLDASTERARECARSAVRALEPIERSEMLAALAELTVTRVS